MQREQMTTQAPPPPIPPKEISGQLLCDILGLHITRTPEGGIGFQIMAEGVLGGIINNVNQLIVIAEGKAVAKPSTIVIPGRN